MFKRVPSKAGLLQVAGKSLRLQIVTPIGPGYSPMARYSSSLRQWQPVRVLDYCIWLLARAMPGLDWMQATELKDTGACGMVYLGFGLVLDGKKS